MDLVLGKSLRNYPGRTLQAAEFAAYCSAAQCRAEGPPIYSDCLDVVWQASERMMAELSYRHPCAGFLLQSGGSGFGRHRQGQRAPA
eukprot:4872606-Pyramimonas_sp.AAC.1